MSQLIEPPQYLVKRLSPNGLRAFLARTRNGDPEKARVRENVAAIIGGSGARKVASLPGPWWHFERVLERFARAIGNNQVSVFGYERNRRVFDLASMRMKRTNVGIKSKVSFGGHPMVTNGKDRVLINADISEITDRQMPARLDAFWFDFCSPLSWRIGNTLKAWCSTLPSGGIWAVTIMAAREREGAPQDRVAQIEELCGSRSVYVERYRWGAPMLVVVGQVP